ncbi:MULTISPECIES: sensor domain-containing protein [Halobacterium]|uniref:sensor domain-containing protein n=1 Tax=Halobacterium TaxID=2239 RepID=UPI00073EC969|nr:MULTISPECIES: sensor domain-containing protein [Halobacterium]MCG1003295.1 sensor domain-containing protein [Halobacterium noricense]
MPTTRAPADRLRSFVGVLGDRRTYRRLLYLSVAIPLGFLYYVVLAFGFVFGVALTVFVVGVPVLLATLLLARVLADWERRVANALLDTDIAPRERLPSLSEDGVLAAVSALVRSNTTWRSVAFLVVKSLVGFLAWLFVLLAGVGALALLLAPLGGTATVLGWSIDTLPERLLAFPLGVLLALTTVHVLVAAADQTGDVATALLGGKE